jgi:hypothetical protein
MSPPTSCCPPRASDDHILLVALVALGVALWALIWETK